MMSGLCHRSPRAPAKHRPSRPSSPTWRVNKTRGGYAANSSVTADSAGASKASISSTGFTVTMRLTHKDAHTIVVRTLFGTLHLRSPRWHQCRCQLHTTRTFSPLAAALPERTTPELLYLESKFAGLVSYGLSAKWLAETLPLGRRLHASAVRLHTQATGERLESELGPEQSMFADGLPARLGRTAAPDLPLTVGLDGGYVHSSRQRSRRDGWFEVIAGKSMPTDGSAKCFGFVQTYDTKPKRRLFELLKSQGMQMNQQVTFLTDGGEDVRDLPLKSMGVSSWSETRSRA